MILLLPRAAGISLDQQHCAKKCHSVFSDSPAKISSCLKMCSFDLFENKEKVVTDDKYYLKTIRQNISICLSNCSQNLDRSTDFRTWSKCRKSCFNSRNQKFGNFFDDKTCNQDCERYWAGTSHLDSCKQQCKEFTKNRTQRPSLNERGKFHSIFNDR